MTTDDLAWVQSRLRNCTNARRQLRICAECLSVAEDTLLERLGYTSLDTFRAAHPQNKQPVSPPVERIYNPVPPEMMMESILYYYGGAPISTVRSMMGYTQTVTPEAIRHRVCNWKKKHPALAAGMPRKRPKPKKETKPMKMTYDEAGLPAYAYAKSPYTGAVVRIVRGERALFGMLDADSNLTIDGLEAKLMQYKPDIAFIDHIGLLSPTDPRQTEYQSIREITRRLKVAAMKMGIVVVELCQINRAGVKGNEGRFCNLEDLRGSGTIEQDANSAIFVENRRTEDSKELRGEDAYQDTAVMYAKNREGPTGVVSMRWQPQYHQWQPTPKEEYEEIDQMNWPQ